MVANMHLHSISRSILFVNLVTTVLPSQIKESPSSKTDLGKDANNNSIQNDVDEIPIQCPTSKKSSKSSQETKIITLIDIESEDCTNDIISKENENLFFIESSGRDHLRPRDACAIESAVKNSGLSGHIIIAMTSPVLNVMANNATCHLFSEHAGKNVFFRHINVDTIFKGTPIHQLHVDGWLKSEENRKTIVQYSDAIRLILIHRYGGWYSDLDMVFLRPLNSTYNGESLANVAASDSVHFSNYEKSSEIKIGDKTIVRHDWGPSISNALFHNSAGHIFLQTAIKHFKSTFVNGVWSSSGPVVLTKALDDICGQLNIQTRPLNPIDYSRDLCSGMTVVEPRLFYPVDWFHGSELQQPRLKEHWDNLFKKSLVVHFYGSSMAGASGGSATVLRPNNYGKEKPAMTYLGPRECPVSFYSTRPF